MSGDTEFPDPDFSPDPTAPDGQARGNPHVLLPHIENMQLREKYIGAVSLLCRVYAAMGRERREDFEKDGDPMSQLAEDFNRFSFSISMQRASGGWGLFKRGE